MFRLSYGEIKTVWVLLCVLLFWGVECGDVMFIKDEAIIWLLVTLMSQSQVLHLFGKT